MWESLDEAIRASVDELNDDEYDKAFNAFASVYRHQPTLEQNKIREGQAALPTVYLQGVC